MFSRSSRRVFLTSIASSIVVSKLGDLKHLNYFQFSSVNNASNDLERIKDLLKNDEPVTWLFMGDSIAQGAKHTYGERSFSEIFSERVRWELHRYRDIVINSAISGAVSKNLLDDFKWRMSQFNSKVTFIMIGVNDAAYEKIKPDDFYQNLSQLVENVRIEKSIPVLLTPNFINLKEAVQRKRLPDFVLTTREVATHKSVLLVDNWQDWTIDYPSEMEIFELLDDAIHPNGSGHKKIAKLLFEKLGIYDAESNLCKY